MRKYLSLIGVLLVLVVFHLMPNVEALVLESDELLFYVSPALLLGMNFDFGGGDGLESYPSLSVQGSSGVFFTGFMDAGEPLLPMVGVTYGYQLIFGRPNNLYFDLQGGLWPFGFGVGRAWHPSTKVSSFRRKLFIPSPYGMGIEYDSKKRLTPYLYGSLAPAYEANQ